MQAGWSSEVDVGCEHAGGEYAVQAGWSSEGGGGQLNRAVMPMMTLMLFDEMGLTE